MKILFLTSRVPYPPHRGDKLRTYNFLRTLSIDHEIALLSFSEQKITPPTRKVLSKFCKQMTFIQLPRWWSWAQAAILYPLSLPSQAAYYLSPQMSRAVTQIASDFQPDTAYIHLFRMLPYRKFIPQNTYTVLDLTDVISKELFRSAPQRPSFEQSLIIREAQRIRLFERSATLKVNETWVISEEDKKDLIAAGGEGKIYVIPNGLRKVTKNSQVQRNPTEHNLLFYGYALARHNQDALNFLLKDILPQVRKNIPEVRLIVAGAGKRRFAYEKYLQQLPVDYLGFRGETTEIFSQASLLIVPVRFSAGAQNKILEALSLGVPVITSPFGNEGVGGTDGEHLAICRTPEEFADRTTYLLRHPDEREEMGKRGQKFVSTRFSWDVARLRMKEIEKINSAVSKKQEMR